MILLIWPVFIIYHPMNIHIAGNPHKKTLDILDTGMAYQLWQFSIDGYRDVVLTARSKSRLAQNLVNSFTVIEHLSHYNFIIPIYVFMKSSQLLTRLSTLISRPVSERSGTTHSRWLSEIQ